MFLIVLRSLLATVSAQNPAEIPSDAEISAHMGKRWAFCIGVGDYRDPDIVDLPNARNDAKGLARVLVEHAEFDHVIEFTDDLGAESTQFPSKSNIRSSFRRFAETIDPRDLVLFSFSGHGVTDAEGEAFLLLADTRSKSIHQTALPFREIVRLVRETGARRSIILLDACRKKVTRRESSGTSGVYPERYRRDGITAVFYAAQKGYHSHDHDASEHGVFARYLISGLRGDADTDYGGNSDGIVTLRELGAHLKEGMSRWSIRTGIRQKPSVRIAQKGMGDMLVCFVQTTGPADVSPETASHQIEAAEMDIPIEENQGGKEKDIIEAHEEAPSESETKEMRKEEIVQTELQETMGDRLIDKPESLSEKFEERHGEEALVDGGQDQTEPSPGLLGAETDPAVKDQDPPDTLQEKSREDAAEFTKEASTPAVIKPAPLYLRKKARNLSPADVKSMLFRYSFYSTCWNYNGDFCNPGGEFQNFFIDNRDGTVTDDATHLMWQKDGSPVTMTWAEAKSYAGKLNEESFAGYSDWRIPTVEELASLMESSWKNGDLFIDPLFDRTQRHLWSLDTSRVNRAWKANLHLGFFMDFHVSDRNSVRLVRSPS